MSDQRPKSAYEIAMEKLKERDRERGESAPAALSPEQKKAIGEARRVHDAKLAEREILHKSDRAKLLSDPEGGEKLQKLEEDYQRDRRRIEEQRDRELEKIRSKTGSKRTKTT